MTATVLSLLLCYCAMTATLLWAKAQADDTHSALKHSINHQKFTVGCSLNEAVLLCCRSEGSDLQQQNNQFVSDMGVQQASVEEAQAQVAYFEQHLQKTMQQV